MRKTFWLLVAWLLILAAPVWASTGSIKKDKVNVRSAPSLKSDVLFQAHLGYPVEVAQTKGKWVKIKDWQDNVGWVYRPLISKKVHTAVIMPEKVNIRKGPGKKYRVVAQGECGEVYKVFKKKDGWVKVGYYLENQQVGWVRHDLLWGE
jgi:SH3-like domain-containing protein